MALIDKASLLMVPSTYEAGKLYNVLPSGNRAPDSKGGAGYDQTRADFDFDRGSNAAATRIGSDGLLKKYQENLLTESNNFSDSDWTKTKVDLTSGQLGYDGTNNAWLMQTNTTGSYPRVTQSGLSTDVNTFSIYAKAGNSSHLFLLNNRAGADTKAWFDLSNGTIGTGTEFIDRKIEDVGNGWYRCSVTSSFTDTSYYVASVDGDNIITGTIGDSIYIQSAQLETGMVSTDYLNSTSVTAKAGVLIDLPRINYDANGENGALLLEPSRQQLFQFSEYFGGWTLSNSTITSNATTSPEGVNNASLYTSTNVTNYVRNIITASNATYTLSVFVKRVSTDEFRMNFSDGVTGEIRYVFNLADETSTLTKSGGTISGYSADFENYGNGWYRLHITAITNAGTAITAYFETDNETGSFYLYGAMLEQNASYVSSYIPNHGTSGGVTRAADSCSVTGASDVIGQTEGTIYAEINAPDIKGFGTYSAIRIYDGTSSNEIAFIFYGNGRVQATVFNGGSLVVNINDGDYGLSIGVHKIAFAYKANDYAFYIDGSVVGTDASAGVPVTNQVDLFYNNVGSLNHKQVALFNERLTNAELATLTTL